MHIHYVDGAIVVHTHPMDHHKGHSHSSGDYLTLAEFTSFNTLLPEIEFNLVEDQFIHFLTVDLSSTLIELITLSSHSPRDPPFHFV